MAINYDPTPFDRHNYREKVSAELADGRELNALLLIHGYIDAYLREWLFICGSGRKAALSEQLQKSYARIGFGSILLLHFILGNIGFELYNRLVSFNSQRNGLAHELIRIDTKDERTRRKIRQIVGNGLAVCDEIVEGYARRLDAVAKKVS